MAQSLWKTVWKFQKKLNRQLSHDPVIILLGFYPREMKMHVHAENLCMNVHSSFICNRQSVPHIGELLNKLVHLYHELLLSNKRE